jgi:hypothetical protein
MKRFFHRKHSAIGFFRANRRSPPQRGLALRRGALPNGGAAASGVAIDRGQIAGYAASPRPGEADCRAWGAAAAGVAYATIAPRSRR